MSSSETTSDDDVRWTYLASLITALLFITLCALLIGASAGVFSLGTINQPWFLLYAMALTAASAWLWGEEMKAAWRK